MKVEDFYSFDNIHDCLDWLFDKVNDLQLEGKFDEIDQFMYQLDLTKIDPTAMLGVLSITYAGESKNAARKDFYDRVKTRLSEIFSADRVENMLQGLEQ